MRPDCTLRRLTPADAPAYKALRDATLAADPTAFTSDAGEEAARSGETYHARLGSPGATTTQGAWTAERLVGALTCERDRRIKVRHVGHLTGMMVDDAERGAGIGRRLLGAVIDDARQAGLQLLTLSVTAGNAAAIHLYRSYGFSTYGTLPRAIRVGDEYHAKEQMALLL